MMTDITLQNLRAKYQRDGYISGVDIISPEDAAYHRQQMETAEMEFGPLHYRSKIHTILRSPLQLAHFI